MKKTLLIVLTALLFVACGDKDDPYTPVPEPYFNPVQGKWWIQLDVNLVGEAEFTKDFEANFKTFKNGKQISLEENTYTIDKTQIIFDNSGWIITRKYEIKEDKLYLYGPKPYEDRYELYTKK